MKPKAELINPDEIETNYHQDSNNLIIGLAVLLMIAVCGFILYVVSVLEAVN